jgi:hypothetical protein
MALTAARFVEITDKLTAAWIASYGDPATGYGLGGPETLAKADDWGFSRLVRDLEAILLAYAEYDYVAAITAAHAAWQIAGAASHINSVLSLFQSTLNTLCVGAGITGVSSVDTFATYYNTGAGGPWNALCAPSFRDVYYALAGENPTAANCYYEVLHGADHLHGLRSLVVGGTQTAGTSIDSASYAGGFGQISWVDGIGSGTVTVTGVWRKPDGTIQSGANGTATMTGASGTAVLTPPTANALLVVATSISAAAGITGGTIYAEAKRPAGRTNPPPITDGTAAPALVPMPTGFGWTPPVDIYELDGVISIGEYEMTDFLPECLRSGLDVYVSTTGNDANSGLDAAHPKLTPYAALHSIAGRRRVHFAAGVYNMDEISVSPDADRGPTAFLSDGNEVYLRITGLTGAWVDDGGGVWHAPCIHGRTFSIRDKTVLDGDGFPSLLTSQASLVDCQANTHSYFLDTAADNLYVHRTADRAPDDNLVVGENENAVLQLDAYSYYLDEGIHIEGGIYAFTQAGGGGSENFNFFWKGGSVHYCYSDGLMFSGWGLAIIDGTELAANGVLTGQDGLSWNNATGLANACKALVLNVHSHHNGTSGGMSGQSFTTHNGGYTVVSVNCEGDHSGGQTWGDTGTGKEACFGCYSHDSRGGTGSNVDFYTEATLWLYLCRGAGSTDSLKGSGTIYTHACTLAGNLVATPVPF